MLDPLTAIGLASNILQLVELAGQVAGTSHKLYKSANGALAENIEVERVTSDLRQLCDKLSDDARIDDYNWRESEKKLQEVARECDAPAQKLINILDDLKVQKPGGLKSWQAIRSAIKTLRKKDEIESIQKQLGSMVSNVSLHLLRVLNDKTSTVCFDIRELSRMARQFSEEHKIQLQRAQSELLEAVSKSQATLAWDFTARQVSSSPHLERPMITAANREQSIDTVLTKLQSLSEAAGMIATPQAITTSLLFKEMPMRVVQIPDSYERTNSWIFDPIESPFPTWLQSLTGVFWINGKAGSGKSTLIKFLADHPSTRKSLEKWAGIHSGANLGEKVSKLTIASFYFWKSGYPMQRSLKGLLQSILFYIFNQCPSLVSIACPERWQQNDAFHRNPSPWNVSELSRTLDVLLKVDNWPSRFCFFIDGLDEYAGSADDQYALIEDLDRLAECPFVKVCVSSRPWNVFRVAYGKDEARNLVLQDHNKKDLDVYITGKLENDTRFRRLAATDERAHDFAIEIRNRANGVFLWVFLVVRSLLDGLTEEDDIPMLQSRLRALPPTLEEYFRHMLDSIDSSYKKFTARALLLASNATQPLSILPYFYLETEIANPDYALQAPVEPATIAAMKHRKQRVVSWVNKWCRDLLEVNERKDLSSFTDPVQRYSVDFIHRTARDFLVMEEMQNLFQADAGRQFNVRLSLCRSYLAQVKHLSEKSVGQDFLYLAGFLMYHAKECEAMDSCTPIEILNDLDRVGEQTAQFFNTEHWTGACARFEVDDDGESERQSSFLAYAVEFDLQLYVQDVLDAMREPLTAEMASTLAKSAKKPTLKHDVFDGPREPLPNILSMLPHYITKDHVEQIEADELTTMTRRRLQFDDEDDYLQTSSRSRPIRLSSRFTDEFESDAPETRKYMSLYGTSQPGNDSLLSSFTHPGLSQSRTHAMNRYNGAASNKDRSFAPSRSSDLRGTLRQQRWLQTPYE